MASTHLTFASEREHRDWLAQQSRLPRGFRVGTARLSFVPVEVSKPSSMTLSLLALERPTQAFAAMFTRNAFPGAPIVIGRRRLAEPTLGAVIVNSKVANVCAPGGLEAAERLSGEVARTLGIAPAQVLPSSTGVIGWRLPLEAMIDALPRAAAALQSDSILPAAEGIMTTDLYPKVRRVELGGGSIVGIAKGAGMIEPNLATMLVYLLTDIDVSRDRLRRALVSAVDASFHAISVDTDTSTSDTVVALSSGRAPSVEEGAFEAALVQVCTDLAEDVVRNGEGVHHVIRVEVRGAPDARFARGVGKSVVSSPLFQCAVCGNDPNVGRLVMAIGKFAADAEPAVDLGGASIRMGGRLIFSDRVFRLDQAAELALSEHLRQGELYATSPSSDGLTFRPPLRFPPHERVVDIVIDLGIGDVSAVVLGSDRSHEYITENADYRS